jgi:hypothetical protein
MNVGVLVVDIVTVALRVLPVRFPVRFVTRNDVFGMLVKFHVERSPFWPGAEMDEYL